ncbi:hypothetical protein B0I35DRAFT_429555 [Stachybotrys elegans]|uniref:Protein prenyltransferase n=1 Tax=Stachybotrys elegans TaxID=80388 RepID=A0A8K0WSA9_9HYPO|nr:hypothetical protein B0I35DRAFT_429555 [Stachybotrys elegans]
MSRALDPRTRAALKRAIYEDTFKDIAEVLSERYHDLLEIEFVPDGHPDIDPGTTYLQEGHAIGIPKAQLVRAFQVAYRMLAASRKQAKIDEDGLRKATAVLLLTDPEHLTAANTRKRLIKESASTGTNQELLQKEKYLVDSFLTSRLHRHTKSPTIWSHRRWLMDQYTLQGLTIDVVNDFKKVILVSAERHPRNYYAWSEARSLIKYHTGDEEQLLSTLTEETKKWCLAHHDDISGWGFLMYLLDHRSGPMDVLEDILKLTQSFRWSNEAVWYFLRNMATKGYVTDLFKEQLEHARETLWQTADENSLERRVLVQTRDWISAQTSDTWPAPR